MTWTKLLASKDAQRHKTSRKELDNMRALIARDQGDAAVAGLSADRRFATAYNAALQAANMAIACAGYRITSKVGHHRISFESAKFLLGNRTHRYAD
jgi:homoserine acetyltransferase